MTTIRQKILREFRDRFSALSAFSVDRFDSMHAMHSDGAQSHTWPKFVRLGETTHVTKCERCGKSGLKSTVVCAVVDSTGAATTEYHYFGSDCASEVIDKGEKKKPTDFGKSRVLKAGNVKPNEGQMELFSCRGVFRVDRFGVRPNAGQMNLWGDPDTGGEQKRIDWDESEHPRWKKGDTEHHGGQFAPKEPEKNPQSNEQLGLFGDVIPRENPEAKKPPQSSAIPLAEKDTQQSLFAGTKALPGQMNLFADREVPDDLLEKKPELAKEPEPASEPELPAVPSGSPPQEKPSSSRPTGPYSLAHAEHDYNAMREGATADEVKQWFRESLAGKDGLTADLSKKTVDQLKKMGAGGYHANSMKKADLVNDLVRKVHQQYHIGDSLSYNPSDKNGWLNAVMKGVDSQTDESLNLWREKRKEKINARKAEVERTIEGLKEPKTLEDFRNVLRAGGGYHSLTSQQQAQYDELAADHSRGLRTAERVKSSEVAALSGEGKSLDFNLTKNYHSKRGQDIYTEKFAAAFSMNAIERFAVDPFRTRAARAAWKRSSDAAKAKINPNEWVQENSKTGRIEWRNTRTNEIRYQNERPGGNPGQSQQPVQQPAAQLVQQPAAQPAQPKTQLPKNQSRFRLPPSSKQSKGSHHVSKLQNGQQIHLLAGHGSLSAGHGVKFLGRSDKAKGHLKVQAGPGVVLHIPTSKLGIKKSEIGKQDAGKKAILKWSKPGKSGNAVHEKSAYKFANEKHGVLVRHNKTGKGYLLHGGRLHELKSNEYQDGKLTASGVKIRERIHRDRTIKHLKNGGSLSDDNQEFYGDRLNRHLVDGDVQGVKDPIEPIKSSPSEVLDARRQEWLSQFTDEAQKGMITGLESMKNRRRRSRSYEDYDDELKPELGQALAPNLTPNPSRDVPKGTPALKARSSVANAIKSRNDDQADEKNKLAHSILETFPTKNATLLENIARDVEHYHRSKVNEANEHNSAWNSLSKFAGMSSDKRMKKNRDIAKSIAQGKDSESAGFSNFDQVKGLAKKYYPWIVPNEGSEDEDLMRFLSDGPVNHPPVHHPSTIQGFWDSRQPEYHDYVSSINDGEKEHQPWSPEDWYTPQSQKGEIDRGKNDEVPFSANRRFLVEKFSIEFEKASLRDCVQLKT